MISAPDTRDQKYLVVLIKGALGTSISEEMTDIFEIKSMHI